MVYLHFPSELTEDEKMLQKKYLQLRQKKKALSQLKATRQETLVPKHTQCSSEAKPDAKEVAKKLLKSGAISAIKVENKEKQCFKRKRNAIEKSVSGAMGYQPFSTSCITDEVPRNPQHASSSPSDALQRHKPVMKKKLCESFVSSRQLSEPRTELEVAKECGRREHYLNRSIEQPREGNTVYVHCYGVTHEILEKIFQPLGSIINISVKMGKNCGFVTFQKMEVAEMAIKTMNGVVVEGVRLNVSMARRQPFIAYATPESSSLASHAENIFEKGSHKQDDAKRSFVAYDNL